MKKIVWLGLIIAALMLTSGASLQVATAKELAVQEIVDNTNMAAYANPRGGKKHSGFEY